MARFPDGDQLLLGRGKVYFDRFDEDGNSTGERFMGEVSTFEVNGSPETRDKYTMTEPASGLLKRAVIRQNWEFSLEMNEYTPENLALALLGEAGGVQTVTAGAVTSEPIGADAGIVLGTWYQVASRGAITTLIVEDGATPLTIDVDYVADLATGRIYFLEGGATTLVGGETTITCDYTKVAGTYAVIAAGTQALIEGKLVFIGDNVVGPNYHFEAWRVQITPDGALALLSDDYGAPKLKGGVLHAGETHPTEPYFRATLIEALP